MNLTPRVKFNVALDSSGDMEFGAPTTGNQLPAEGANFQYLLEDIDGNWEIGYYKPDNSSGGKRIPNATLSDTVFTASTPGLKCSIIATPGAYVNVSPLKAFGSDEGVGPGPINTMLGSLVIGERAEANDVTFSDGEAVVVGCDAEVNAQGGTALGFQALAKKRSSMALGVRARTTNPGEIAFGPGTVPHITHLPVITNAYGYEVGDFPWKAVTDGGMYGMVVGDLESLFPANQSEYYKAMIRVQGMLVVSDGAVGDTSRKVIDVDYAFLFGTGGTPGDILWSNFTTKFSGSAVVDTTCSLDTTTLFPKVTIITELGQLVGHGMLTVTKLMRL